MSTISDLVAPAELVAQCRHLLALAERIDYLARQQADFRRRRLPLLADECDTHRRHYNALFWGATRELKIPFGATRAEILTLAGRIIRSADR